MYLSWDVSGRFSRFLFGLGGKRLFSHVLQRLSVSFVATVDGLLMLDTLPVVDQNPDVFADAYWEINSLRIYTPVVG